nr:3-oxoacyl-ACP synthase [Allomuricauda sp.]
MEAKEKLLQFCWDHIESKKTVLHNRSSNLRESLALESKSTAGDKHETGRAMVQLEQEKLGRQLLELDKMVKVLQQMDLNSNTGKVSLGTWVKTSGSQYFISIPAGSCPLEEGTHVFCISAVSPIAKLLMGKEKQDTFIFNGRTHKILKVL